MMWIVLIVLAAVHLGFWVWQFVRWDSDGSLAGVILGGLALGLILILGSLVSFVSRSCENTALSLGYQGEWTLWTDCLVTLSDGTVVPLDLLRFTDLVGE